MTTRSITIRIPRCFASAIRRSMDAGNRELKAHRFAIIVPAFPLITGIVMAEKIRFKFVFGHGEIGSDGPAHSRTILGGGRRIPAEIGAAGAARIRNHVFAIGDQLI